MAIAALLCGAKSAFCLDIDPSAVTGTIENAEINGIDASRITAIHANILEDADFIKPGGIFISSGILNEKSDAVEQALLRNNYTILERNTMGDWVSFVCQK